VWTFVHVAEDDLKTDKIKAMFLLQTNTRKRSKMKPRRFRLGHNSTFNLSKVSRCLAFATFILSITTTVQGKQWHCSTEPTRCDFITHNSETDKDELKGFEFDGSRHYRCISPSEIHSSLPPELPFGDDDPHLCKTKTDGASSPWGICDAGCYNANGYAEEYNRENWQANAVFCKAKRLQCVFPFTDEQGATHHQCAPSGGYTWCATLVDPQSGKMVPGMWAKCDQSSCAEFPRVATVDSETNGISINVKFMQNSPSDALQINGVVTGLTEGQHGLHVHEAGDCSAAGGHLNPLDVNHGAPLIEAEASDQASKRHVGDLGNIVAASSGEAKFSLSISSEQAALFGELSVLDRPLVVHELPDDLGLGEDTEDASVAADSQRNGRSGTPLACGVIRLLDDDDIDSSLTWIVIYVCIAIVALILLAIIAFVVYWCIKKKGFYAPKPSNTKEPRPEGGGGDDVSGKQPNGQPPCDADGPFGEKLPFLWIDEKTPDGSPRLGRSNDKLAYLNSRNSSIGRSRGSLSDEGDVKNSSQVAC